MKMLTVSLLVCAMMALALAVDEDNLARDAGPIVVQGPCPKDWSHYEGRCYRFVSNPLPWAMAEKSCQRMKANLVSVHSLEENTFLQKMIIKVDQSNPESWIGASDCQQEGIWLWSDGTDSSFRDYCDSLNQGHGCILSNAGARTCWVNQDCSFYHPYVCALDMGDVLQTPSSPTPAGVTE